MSDKTQSDQANLERAGLTDAAKGGNTQTSSDASRSQDTAQDRAAASTAGQRSIVDDPAATRQPQTREERAAQEGQSSGPRVDVQTETGTAESFTTMEGRKAQIEQELRDQQRLSDDNREGHEKNMGRIAKAHEQNKASSVSGDSEERAIPDNPTSGLEHNRNTPRVDKAGNKHWY